MILLEPPLSLKGHAAQRQIVTLAATTRKEDLLGRAVQYVSQLLSRLIQCAVGVASECIDARSISVMLRPIREHGFHHPWINGGGGGMIEVDYVL
jgi:hypothetical protein